MQPHPPPNSRIGTEGVIIHVMQSNQPDRSTPVVTLTSQVTMNGVSALNTVCSVSWPFSGYLCLAERNFIRTQKIDFTPSQSVSFSRKIEKDNTLS